MPIGIITNALATAIGGLLGAGLGNHLSARIKDNLNLIFGACAMCMGIGSICNMQNMPAVILSTILGTIIGLAIHLGDRINDCGLMMQRFISRFVKNSSTSLSEEEFQSTLLTAVILFCASGTGIYGSIVSGMNGDQSIMLAKSFLDLPTALIFACSLGAVVAVVAIPQFLIFLALFFMAQLIYPLTTPTMIADFKACGGLIIFVTGFRMIKVKMFPIADMIPALLIVMPISWFWTTVILPLVAA